ncbi:M17 family metallopeptidase [Bacteroidota bacterium]
MRLSISKAIDPAIDNVIYIIDKGTDLNRLQLSEKEKSYVAKKIQEDKDEVILNRYDQLLILLLIDLKESASETLESARKNGNKVHKILTNHSIQKVYISSFNSYKEYLLALAEGIALTNYQFLKYFKDKEDREFSLKELNIVDEIEDSQIKQMNHLIQGVYYCRDLINEPVSYLTAEQLAEETKKIGMEAGFKVEIFNKNKIQALNFGGLIAVNKGSVDPPTFSILEWKSQKPANKKPIILVGKGIVYDTGGLSLKPTRNSMDSMKSDMSGAAAVIGTFYSVSKSQLPVHIIGLIPATDNRPDGNAYTPGDVVKMHSGSTVEVLNTDAEGRMVLADALSYAKNYEPQLVIDLATLTGAAARAIGSQGLVGMGNANEKVFNSLLESGEKVYERIVKFPFWEEYNDMLKSQIADLKNIGGDNAGAITAGKFLEHFTDYPYIHLDIAGPAFLTKNDSYRGKGGTGVGVRLLFEFLKNYKE